MTSHNIYWNTILKAVKGIIYMLTFDHLTHSKREDKWLISRYTTIEFCTIL